MTWEPYTRKMKFESADLYEGDHCGFMYDFNCPSIKQSLTPDHNVFTEEHGRTTARHVFGKRVSIPTSGFKDGNEESLARLQVALMADGSREGNLWRISFKKDRKIERFKSLCHEAGAKFWQVEAKEGYKRFHVEWPNQTKVWDDSLLELPLENRQALVEEAGYWDGDFHGNGIRFFTADKAQAESFERIAVASGFTTTITKTVASEDSYNPGGTMFVVGLTRKVSRGVRATRWSARLFDGKIYCLLVPSKHFLIRYKGTISVTGNTNFQMAAMTLYVTMGRESVVAAAELLGFADAGQWDQDRLVQLCGQLMLKYRKKYKRLTSKEWYKEIADELVKTGRMVNAFGITRTFLGDPKDNGTQREATAFIGQSDTAGNMNRAMKEIDFGIIEPHFRDGPNPDYGDEPRRMTYDSHGFALHLQVHDNFVAQLNLKHPLWRMAAHNLLYVMNRPIIIKGRTVRVKAEAEIGLRWGKGMIEWDGNIESLMGSSLNSNGRTKSMSATTGIAAIGTYGEALRSARVAELLTYIPDPDSTSSSGSVAGGTNGTNNTYLDEMSPACATQLRVELNAIIATLSSADGQYTVTAGDATNTFIDIVTGIPVFTLANTSWSIRRAGSLVSQGVGLRRSMVRCILQPVESALWS